MKCKSTEGTIFVLEKFDLLDKSKVEKFFQSNIIDGVIHFAASKAVGESVEKPLLYYNNNLGSLLNVLEAMLANKQDHFIFSSQYKILTLSQILSVLGIDDFSTSYKEDIINIRNKFAHAELLTNEEGEKYFQYGKDGLKFNNDLCKKVRSDIQTHSNNLMGLIEKLEE